MSTTTIAPSLQSLFDKPLKVLLTDGRTIYGKFHCLDRDRNVVLVDVFARLPGTLSDGKSYTADWRSLGIVMVPGKHLVKAEAEVPETSSM